MSLGLRCPTCRKRMSVPERSLGRRVQCPRCEAVFRFTGQTEITLGRVPSAPSESAEMATPVVPKMLETTPPAQAPPPNFEQDPAAAAAMSGEELTEILETDVVDDELPWDFNEVALDAVIEPDDEAVLDVEAEVIEVSPEDLETDAERAL